MKRRVAALLAVLALTVSLTACGGNAAAPASSSTTVDKTEEQQTSAPGVEASAPAEEQEASAAEPASDVQEAPEPVLSGGHTSSAIQRRRRLYLRRFRPVRGIYSMQ